MISFGEKLKFKLKLGKKYLVVNEKRAKLFKSPGVRKTYVFSDFIIKIDSDEYYRGENSQGYREVELFMKIEDVDKSYFAEPIDYGIFENGIYWVAQKFENLEPPKMKSEKIDELIEKYNVRDLCNGEHSYSAIAYNWALVNDAPLIYDYGI